MSLPEKILVTYCYSRKRKFSLEGDLNIDRFRISKEIEQSRDYECEEKRHGRGNRQAPDTPVEIEILHEIRQAMGIWLVLR